MAPHKTYFFVALLAAFITFSAISCSGFDEQTQQINEALSDSLLSTTETWNLDMEIIQENTKKIRLQGSYAATFSNKRMNETRIKGPVSIHVFDTTAAIKTWVNSDSAIYRAEEAQFELFGDVRVRTRDDRHLESEYLMWNQGDNKISTPQFVIITTPTDSIAGTGFTGTSDLSNYTIKKPSGRIVLD